MNALKMVPLVEGLAYAGNPRRMPVAIDAIPVPDGPYVLLEGVSAEDVRMNLDPAASSDPGWIEANRRLRAALKKAAAA